jgi:hypothetical protein
VINVIDQSRASDGQRQLKWEKEKEGKKKKLLRIIDW